MKKVSLIIGNTKNCTKCGERKLLSEFPPNKKMSSGVQSWCRKCNNKHLTKYYSDNPSALQDSYKRRALAHRKNPIPSMLTEARARAKKKGLEFNLTKEDIKIPDKCPVFGVALIVGSKISSNREAWPSLDRINPLYGYVKGNVQVISYKANVMKQNATPEQLIQFANWVLTEFTEKYNGRSRELKTVA